MIISVLFYTFVIPNKLGIIFIIVTVSYVCLDLDIFHRKQLLSMNLGNAIQTLRKEQRISRKELAERSSLSVTALYNIENNISFPSKDTIDKICNSLSIPISFLLFYSITEDDIPEDKRSSFHYLQEPMKKFLMEK